MHTFCKFLEIKVVKNWLKRILEKLQIINFYDDSETKLTIMAINYKIFVFVKLRQISLYWKLQFYDFVSFNLRVYPCNKN